MSTTRTGKRREVKVRTGRAVKIVKGVSNVAHDAILTPRPTSYLSRFASFALILFFVFVPVADARASEVDATNTASSSTESALVEQAVGASDLPSDSAPSSEPASQDENLIPEETFSSDVVVTEAEEVTEEIVVEDSTTVAPDGGLDTGTVDESATSSETLPEIEATTTTPAESDLDSDLTPTDEAAASTTTSLPVEEEVVPEVLPEPLPAEVAPVPVVSTTSLPAPEVPATGTHTTDADKFNFGESDCVSMGNGAYQCVKRDGEAAPAGSVEIVSAREDSEGDLEIFYNDGAKEIQITDNDYDDDAPIYDPTGKGVVWHASIDDRYQIMWYDIETGSTLRMTKGDQNSMQPSVYDGVVVYQTWSGDDWDIALIDEERAEIFLTDNTTHDLAPSLNGEFVTWQAEEGGEWVAKVYDRATKRIETVKGAGGAKVENPRIVLVFDTKDDNGDVATMGYDPERGTLAPLEATPAPLPERIPEPEQEREERALIQPSAVPRVETKASSTPTAGNDGPDPLPPDTAGTSTAPIDSASSTTPSADVVITDSNTPTQSATSSDLVLDLRAGALLTGEGAELPDIPDLVIPAFNQPNDVATTTL